MFGLLKQRTSQPDHRSDFRKSYCGTCKAIGKIYGQKERLLLNYDVVFLSELLAELSSDSNDFAGISVGRCFSLPKLQNQIPDFLAYSASANMLLASIKVQDNIDDGGFMAFAWRAVAWLQKKQFAKARRLLEYRGLQMTYVDTLVQEQFRREHEQLYLTDISGACSYYAEMTGLLTGEIFRQAAHAVSRPEWAENLYQIGKAYGEIVYLVDVMMDYEKDMKRGTFNLLHAHAANNEASLSPDVSALVNALVANNIIIIRKQLFELPIAAQKKHLFSVRVEKAVHAATSKNHSCNTSPACHTHRISIPEKFWLLYYRAKNSFSPRSRNAFRFAGASFAAGFMALLLLAWPLRGDASLPASPPPSDCGQEIGDCCCQCCCDSCSEMICPSS
jgi:hypothetical protein